MPRHTDRESGARPRRRLGRILRENVRYRLTVLLFFGSLVAFIDRANLAVAMPYMRDDFEIGPQAMGIILGMFAVGQVLSQPPSGWLVDKLGPRILYTAAALSWFVLTAATALARGAASLLTLRFLLGVGEGPLQPAANKATGEWFPKRERGLAIGLYQVGSELGPALTLPLVAGIIAISGWRTSFVVCGLFGLMLALVWNWWYRSPRRHRSLTPKELAYIVDNGARSTEQEALQGSTSIRWIDLFRYLTIWGLLIVMFSRQMLNYFFVTWYPSFLADARDFSLSELGLYGVIPGVMALIGNPIGGGLSDYLIRRNVSHTVARKAPLLAGLLLGTSIALAIFVHNPLLTVLLLGVSSMGVSVAAGPLYALMVDVTPHAGNLGSTIGLMTAAGSSAGFVGPALIGVLLGASGGSYVLPLLVISGVLVGGVLSALLLVGPAQKLPIRVRG